MITERSIEIDASPELVWAMYADVERWPDWTPSVTKLDALDGSDLEVGRRYAITQPRLPKLVWTVATVEPGRSWTWEQRSLGSFAAGVHEVVPITGDRTLVRMSLEQRGPIGGIVGRLAARMTRRYVELEASGLKAHCEAGAGVASRGASA